MKSKTTKLSVNFAKQVSLALAFAIALSFGSCKKNESGDPNKPSNKTAAPTPLYPQPADADAVLIAVKSSVPSPVSMPSMPGMPGGQISIELGMGIAIFKNNAKADKVILNNTELKFTNGVHIWMPDYTNLTNPSSFLGIDLNGAINWDVSNPNIKKTVHAIPETPTITSGKVVDRSTGYRVITDISSSTKKVIYAIYSDNNKYVMKEVSAPSNSAHFTTPELATLSPTKNGIIQANAYSIESQVIDGKKVYFVKQNSYSITGVEIK